MSRDLLHRPSSHCCHAEITYTHPGGYGHRGGMRAYATCACCRRPCSITRLIIPITPEQYHGPECGEGAAERLKKVEAMEKERVH